MQNYPQSQTYRTLLAQRQGKGFSEFEVTEIMQQVLPQLAKIHAQQQAHGSVFLDNLVQNQGDNHVLLVGAIAPYQQQPGQASISKDIYALGVAMIALLTAKPLNLLRHPDGSWNWEEHCIVSDQLAALINRMIADKSQESFVSANEVLSALSFSPAQPAIFAQQYAYPTTISESATGKRASLSTVIRSPNRVNLAPWQLALMALAVCGILTAIVLPSFLSQETKAKESPGKRSIVLMLLAQKDFRSVRPQFASSFEELRNTLDELSKRTEYIDFTKDTRYYTYSTVSADSSHAYMTATSKDKNLKSYGGVIVLLGNGNATSLTCETDKASTVPPDMQQVIKGNIQCPQSSHSLEPPQSAGNFIPYSPSSTVPLNPNNSAPANPFDSMAFPQRACGDSLPTNPSAYPVNFYPVFVKYSERNLQVVKSRFCGDAFQMVRKDTRIEAIQIGSFTSFERAESFKDFLNKNVGGAEVGQPTIVESR